MQTNMSDELADLEARWRVRQQEWSRKLGRLRLGVEPLEEQLDRYRRVTWGLTVVPGVIAVMFLSLFAVFGRPDIGLILVAILPLPVIVFSWVGYKKLERRADAYRAELSKFEAERSRLMGAQAAADSPLGPD